MRINKFTPIAASVALSLGLTGCNWFDDDNKKETVKPVQTFEGSASASFGTEVTGRAVKGSLSNAAVVVKTMNDAGEMIPVAFRLAASADESFTATANTQAEADAMAKAKVLAANPESVLTAMNGGYSLFVEDDFTGPLYITVTTSSEGDDSMVKCDSFTGCGDYDTAPGVSEEAGMENNGDSNIDFGEWYKDDVTLQVVKFISAPAAAASVRGMSYADGENKSTQYFANLTLFTSIAAELLLEGAGNGEAISEDAISQASLKTLIQLLGPDTAIEAAALLADISTGGAVDFTELEDGDSLDAGTLALIQTAISLQSMAGTGTNGSLNELMSQLAKGVSDGKVADNDDDTVKAVAAALQQSVINTSLIFAALVTGEGVDEAFAAVAQSLGITDPDAIAKLKSKATKAVEKVVKDAKKAGADDELKETAKNVKDALSKIGCSGEECDAGDDFDSKAAQKLNEKVIEAQADLDAVMALIDTAQASLADVTELGDAGLETNEQVIAYSSAVYLLNGNVDTYTVWQKQLKSVKSKMNGIAKAAAAFAAKNSDYQQLADQAASVRDAVAQEYDNVVSLIASIEAEVVRADEAVSALGLEFEVTKANAVAAAAAALEAATVAMTADTTLATAMIAVEAADVSNLESATAALEAAEQAIAAATDSQMKAAASISASNLSTDAATAFKKVATEADDIAMADAQLETAAAELKSAAMYAENADDALLAAQALYDTAMDAIAKFTVLVDVKAGTETVTQATILTKSGGKALFDKAEVIYDILTEAWDLGDEADNVQSTRFPEWTYSFDKDALELSLSNDTTSEMISVNGVIETDTLVFAFGGTVTTEDGVTVIVETLEDTAQATQDCVDVKDGKIAADLSDSCLIVKFNDEISSDTLVDGEVETIEAWSRVQVTDGDSGFTGMLSLEGSDLTSLANIKASGMTGDTEFTAMIGLDSAVDEMETYMVNVELHNDIAYMMSLSAVESADFSGSVDALYSGKMMKFGTVTEITNGISIEYIDGEVIDYTDISFLDMTK